MSNTMGIVASGTIVLVILCGMILAKLQDILDEIKGADHDRQ